MAWMPLAGKRIVVTRARSQAARLARKIEELGGEVIELPTIEIEAARDISALDRALARIEGYHWLFFTSVNGVEPFLSRLAHVGKSVAQLAHLQVAAIGSQTAKRLEAAGIGVSLIPTRFQAEGLLEALSPEQVKGKKVLIPRAAKARDLLPETLRQWGAEVDVVEAYRTVIPAVDTKGIIKCIQSGELAIVTFTSSSTVSNFVQLFAGADLASILGSVAIACIGPITAKTVEEFGGKVAIMAREFTIDGLVDAMVQYSKRTEFTNPAAKQSRANS